MAGAPTKRERLGRLLTSFAEDMGTLDIQRDNSWISSQEYYHYRENHVKKLLQEIEKLYGKTQD